LVDSRRLNVFRKTSKVMLIIREPYKEFYYWCQLISFIMKKKRKKMLCANKEGSVSTYGVLWVCFPIRYWMSRFRVNRETVSVKK
jgi:hypothetical protein